MRRIPATDLLIINVAFDLTKLRFVLCSIIDINEPRKLIHTSTFLQILTLDSQISGEKAEQHLEDIYEILAPFISKDPSSCTTKWSPSSN